MPTKLLFIILIKFTPLVQYDSNYQNIELYRAYIYINKNKTKLWFTSLFYNKSFDIISHLTDKGNKGEHL